MSHTEEDAVSDCERAKRPIRTINASTNSRTWYLEKHGKFDPKQQETIPGAFASADDGIIKLDLIDELVREIGCDETVAAKLLQADLVRIVDHIEIPALTGHLVMPGSYGIAYRCECAKRGIDLNDEVDDVFIDTDTKEPLPLQENETWRVKLLVGEWASIIDPNDGHPSFRPWSKQPKYMSRRGASAAALFIPRAINPGIYANCRTLYKCEGEKKAIALAARGYPAISIPGVGNWSYAPDRKREAARTGQTYGSLDPLLLEYVKAFAPECVVICFDSPDIYDNANVVRQLAALEVELRQHVKDVGYLMLPRPGCGQKYGIDDWLNANPSDDFTDYVVMKDDVVDVLDNADERSEGLLRIFYERAKAQQERGILGKASPEAAVKDIIRKLDLKSEAQVTELLKNVVERRLEHNLPQLFESLNVQYRYSHSGGGSVYLVKKVGQLTTYERLPDSDTTPLQQVITAWGKNTLDTTLKPKVVAEVEKLWKLGQTHSFDPRELLPCDLPSSTAHAFSALPEPKPGPMPAWEEFLARTDRTGFLSWLGSVLDPQNRDRRILWLHGAGNDGKSVVAQALARGFGRASSKLPEFIDHNNKHFSSTLEGVRFAYAPENKQPKLLQTGLIRSISGSDDLTIDRKGKDPYEARNHVRLMICSNSKPQITGTRSDVSRLLWCSVKPGLAANEHDFGWPSRLQAEIPQLFWAAIRAYEAAGKTVHMGEEALDLLSEAADAGDAASGALFDEMFTLDSNGFLGTKEFESACRGKRLSPTEKDQLLQYLERQKGVTKSRPRLDDGTRPHGWKAVRLWDFERDGAALQRSFDRMTNKNDATPGAQTMASVVKIRGAAKS